MSTQQVERVLAFLDDGNTVPFIASYRKKQTGGLDEVQIRSVEDEAESIRELQDRRETVLKTIEDQGKLTDDLRQDLKYVSSVACRMTEFWDDGLIAFPTKSVI